MIYKKLLSDANLQISQKISTITNLAKANNALRKSSNFAKIAKVTRFFYCNKKNTSTNIATIKLRNNKVGRPTSERGKRVKYFFITRREISYLHVVT